MFSSRGCPGGEEFQPVTGVGRSLTLIRRFGKLPSRDRGLLLRVALLQGVATPPLVRRLSVPRVRRLLSRLAGRELVGVAPERVVWAVDAVSRHRPGHGTCLTRALVLEAVLRRGGADAQLRLGVVRGEDGRVTGHAWVEAGGRVIGETDPPRRYVPLPDLGAPVPSGRPAAI
jgi:hypothetical protein